MTQSTKFYCLNCHFQLYFSNTSLFFFKISNYYSSVQLTTSVLSNNSITYSFYLANYCAPYSQNEAHIRKKIYWSAIAYVWLTNERRYQPDALLCTKVYFGFKLSFPIGNHRSLEFLLRISVKCFVLCWFFMQPLSFCYMHISC